MKKLALLLLGLLFCQFSNSQTYYPFPTDTAQWNCLLWSQWSPNDIVLTNSQYELQGDTNLNGILYNKVYYLETDNPSYYPEYIGGLREDSTKNIYFFPNSLHMPFGEISFPNDTSEQLLYSFNNLDSGMILPINTDFTEIMVVGVDSILIGDFYHKRYKIQQDGLFDYDYWIEGIGSIKDLLIPFTYEFEWVYYTLCYTDSSTYYINSPNGEDSCHYWIPVGIAENNTERIYSYPNPASKTLRIETNKKNGSGIIRIYNYQGKLIIQDKLINSESIINIEQIESGIYIIELTYGNQKQFTKFVKK